MNRHLRHIFSAGLLALGLAPALAGAVDLAWSGFGTLGYAISNRDYTYQRFIDDRGTLSRDSLLGAQLDARFSPQWSITAQATYAAAPESDSHHDLRLTWGFLAWRPSNDWLLRAGRLRVPLYLYSQTMDVGETHDMARLPTEMYSISPANDFDGLSVTRNWPTEHGELSLEAYHGLAVTTARFWTRDGAPPAIAPGARYIDVHVRATGLVLTLREADSFARLGVHAVRTRQSNGQGVPVRFQWQPLGPELGYWQVNAGLPGPGVDEKQTIRNTIVSAGIEQSFGSGWRATAELARNFQRDTEVAADTRGGYVALFRQIDRFTPYASYSFLKAGSKQLDWYRRLTTSQLPGYLPGAEQVNQAQRLAAEGIWAADQRSVALGTSYALTPDSKLKAEWAHTHVGEVSRLVDTPAGTVTPRGTGIDVFSLNYSFAF
ncbi:hypothetical protein [Derxia gummosa]|uniref:Uncharacterized protein n=1 Tax=Derxia gummosa DSM 723 TaxID=1121388 RepID=A0A8B6X8D8_9BURK|nr:hypothetical protein [Derxia gummosa]